jgi:hypothetical protein
MADVPRISVGDVKQKLQSGADILLVCAYDSEEKFEQNHLDGAISLDEFKQQLDTLSKEQEIAFYCR